MEYLLHILVITGIYIILTLSLNLILGYTGLPAFGHAAFSCVGAYTSSLLALQYGMAPMFLRSARQYLQTAEEIS
jgi:branched-chain amino acid transport system permease protein